MIAVAARAPLGDTAKGCTPLLSSAGQGWLDPGRARPHLPGVQQAHHCQTWAWGPGSGRVALRDPRGTKASGATALGQAFPYVCPWAWPLCRGVPRCVTHFLPIFPRTLSADEGREAERGHSQPQPRPVPIHRSLSRKPSEKGQGPESLPRCSGEPQPLTLPWPPP